MRIGRVVDSLRGRNGRIRREKVGNKGAALKLVAKRKTGVLEGKKLPENFRARAVTFNELANDALEWSKAHKRTWEDDVIRMKPVLEGFGGRLADSITPQELERWLTMQARAKKWKPATINMYKALFSMIFRQGIKNRKITNNPAREVERRRENNARSRYLLTQEEAALRTAMSELVPERLPELDIALHTGMRRSEQYGCEWSWVDLETRVVTVPRSKHGEKRFVFLNDTAVAAFRELWRFSEGQGKVFSHLYRSERTAGPRKWFEQSCETAKIKNFRWHDLRHTFASRLVMAGADIRTVQELMGHKQIQVTLRYAHLAPRHQLQAVQRLCDTGLAANGPTDTRTGTSGFGQLATQAASMN